MPKGRNDNLEWGAWNAICDRCGFKFKQYDLIEEWTGNMVCAQCYEPRHPQDFLQGVPDDPSVAWNRPDTEGDTNTTDINGNTIATVNGIEEFGDASKTLQVDREHPICEWNTALTGAKTVTLSTTNASQFDRFTIYRTAGGSGTLNVGGLYTIPANVNEGVVVEYNGSAWALVKTFPLGL